MYVSRLVLQLSLPNPSKPGREWRCSWWCNWSSCRQAMLHATASEWSKSLLPILRCDLYYRYAGTTCNLQCCFRCVHLIASVKPFSDIQQILTTTWLYCALVQQDNTYVPWSNRSPDRKVHGANMGPIWGRQDPDGPHVGPMNFAIRIILSLPLLWYIKSASPNEIIPSGIAFYALLVHIGHFLLTVVTTSDNFWTQCYCTYAFYVFDARGPFY